MGNQRFSVLQARAVEDQRISNAQFRTLAALGTFGDKDGWCYPKLRTLGNLLGKSRQAVSKDLQALKEFGYLQITPQARDDGSQKGNLYRLLFDTPRKPDVDTPQPGDEAPSTSEVDPPSTSEVDPLTPHSNAPKELTEHQLMFGALADVTRLDVKLSRTKIAKFGSKFIKAGYTAEQVREHFGPGGWWYTQDWRGQNGEPPTLEIIHETIKRAVEESAPRKSSELPGKIKLPGGEVVEA